MAVIVTVPIAALFGVWWWLSPSGPWVAPLNTLGYQGVSLDRPAPTTGHDFRCSVFTRGRVAPNRERIVTTDTEAGGPTNGGVRVIVNESGQDRVACLVGEDEQGAPQRWSARRSSSPRTRRSCAPSLPAATRSTASTRARSRGGSTTWSMRCWRAKF